MNAITRSVLLAIYIVVSTSAFAQNASTTKVPQYKVDASWPKSLPNNWILGQVSGVATDKNDHI